MKLTNTCGSRRSRSLRRNAVGPKVHEFVHASLLFVLPSSHCSPGSTTPLPHTGWQSLSLFALAPGGQQPSPFAGFVIGTNAQAATQVPPLSRTSIVQLLPSLHD